MHTVDWDTECRHGVKLRLGPEERTLHKRSQVHVLLGSYSQYFVLVLYHAQNGSTFRKDPTEKDLKFIFFSSPVFALSFIPCPKLVFIPIYDATLDFTSVIIPHKEMQVSSTQDPQLYSFVECKALIMHITSIT